MSVPGNDEGGPLPSTELWHCRVCGGTHLHISLPAWLELNGNLSFVSCDEEADALGHWCEDCQEHVEVVSEREPVARP